MKKRIYRKKQKKTKTEPVIGDFSNASKRLKEMSMRQWTKRLLKLGIINKDGTLTEKYASWPDI